MNLSVIISTYNRGAIFDQTLMHAVEAVAHLKAEIIVINDINGHELKAPDQDAIPVKILRNTKHGVASKRNLGARHANSELLLFLDDDILISRQSIDQVLELHKSDSMMCLNPNWIYPARLTERLTETAFGRFLIRHNLTTFKGWYNDPSWKDDQLFPSKGVASFHLSISKGNFVRSGGYNENFSEAGCEDYDFPLRLKKIGLKSFIDSRIVVYHNEEDRQTLSGWLNRQRRSAYSRREAVALGYSEFRINYSLIKRFLLFSISILRPVLIGVCRLFRTNARFDFLSFKLIGILEAESIYEGYSLKTGLG